MADGGNEKDVVTVDLTKDNNASAATTPNSKNKMKQGRLMFAKIDKNAFLAKNEVEAKRLREEADAKKLKDEEEAKAKKLKEDAEAKEKENVINPEPVKKPAAVSPLSVTPVPEITPGKKRKHSGSGQTGSKEKTIVLDLTDSGDDIVDLNKSAASSSTPGKENTTAATTPSSAKAKKQALKQQERERLKEEKERAKEEARKAREAAKEAERLKKEAEKKAKELQREEERLERERQKKAKEEQKEQERLEKEKKRQEKQEELEKAKLAKEEAKREKEEARKRVEEEKRKLEEADKAKKLKAAAAFTSFFKKSEKKVDEIVPEPALMATGNNLNLFRVKKNMKLAPLHRVDPDLKMAKAAAVSNVIDVEKSGLNKSELYLGQIKSGGFKAGQSGKTWPASAIKKDDDSDVEIIEDDDDEEMEEIMGSNAAAVVADANEPEAGAGSSKKEEHVKSTITKAKLLQFHDNQRPAYFGTWSKTTRKVGPRRPFGMDSHYFDYDYDSDDDWEEEEQGESLSDEEKDKEEDEKEDIPETDDDNDGFFVAHGVLDKDELMKVDSGDEEQFDEELEMKKQKLAAQQFEAEYNKKKPTKLKPRVFGLFWSGNQNDNAVEDKEKIACEQLLKILNPFKAVLLTTSKSGPIDTSLTLPPPPGSPTKADKIEAKKKKKMEKLKAAKENAVPTTPKALKAVPEEDMPDLIRLVHANVNNKGFLAKEFLHFWSKKNGIAIAQIKSEDSAETPATPGASSGPTLPKSKIVTRINEIANYEKSETVSRKCWIVKTEILEKYGMVEKDLVPNKWDYVLEQPNKTAVAMASPIVNPDAGVNADKAGKPDLASTPKSTKKKSKLSKTSPPSSMKKKQMTLFTAFNKQNSTE